MTSDAPSPTKKSHATPIFMAGLGGLALVALLLWGFFHGRREPRQERERERPVEAATRVTTEGGERVVTLDEATQARSGIETAQLAGAVQREEIQAYGTVLDVQPLVDQRSAYEAARAQADKAQASLEASRRELARSEALHRDDQNVSTKALDAARAALRSDEAGGRAAGAALQALAATTRQTWGPVIGGWLMGGFEPLVRLLDRRDVLVQVTLPPDAAPASPPRNVFLRARAGPPRVSARVVSTVPHAEPRVQGQGFYAIAPAASGLLPGMSVAAFLPVGPKAEGVAVPESAVVLWQGKAWVYVGRSGTAFARREVATDLPAEGGGYLVRGVPAGTPVVVRGAQTLLSEELRAQFQVLGEAER